MLLADIALEPPTAVPTKSPSRVAYADALRAVAIFGVVIDHLFATLYPHSLADYLGQFAGAWGLDCFFVLSGFLLSRPYLDAALARRAFPSSRLFLARRFFRIWPLYAVAVLLSILAVNLHGTHPVPIATGLAYRLLGQNFLPPDAGRDFNGPLWTMAVDADFYLLLPLLAYAYFGLIKPSVECPQLRTLMLTIAAAVIASLAYRAIVVAFLPSITSTSSPYTYTILRSVFEMGAPFGFGIALGLITETHRHASRSQARLALAAGLFLAILDIALPARSAIQAVTSDFVGGLSVTLLLFGAINDAVPTARGIVASRAVIFASSLAYAVYLFHSPVMLTVYNALGGHRFNFVYPVRFQVELVSIMFVMLFVIAYGAHRFIERRFLVAKDRLRENPSLT